MGSDQLDQIIRTASVITVRLALAHVCTLDGANRIYFAERRGLNRLPVLRAASRRIEELDGSQAKHSTPLLVVEGEAIESPSRPDESKPRIVEAVGLGRRHSSW